MKVTIQTQSHHAVEFTDAAPYSTVREAADRMPPIQRQQVAVMLTYLARVFEEGPSTVLRIPERITSSTFNPGLLCTCYSTTDSHSPACPLGADS
jgi:hypothetical protein